MSRAAAIARAHAYFDRGEFLADLKRRVAIPSTSQEPERKPDLRRYLDHEIVPALELLGFASRVLEDSQRPPILLAARTEGTHVPTILIYGHGDTIRGMDDRWRSGLSPWALTVEGDRFYGRGTADNDRRLQNGQGLFRGGQELEPLSTGQFGIDSESSLAIRQGRQQQFTGHFVQPAQQGVNGPGEFLVLLLLRII